MSRISPGILLLLRDCALGLILMPRLQDVDEALYTCPRCKQTVQRTRADFDTPTLRPMFGGKLPAYLLCGRCYSHHPGRPATHMWRTDIKPSDRRADLWGRYGSKTSKGIEATRGAYRRIRDVSFARCRRFVAYPVTSKVVTDTGQLLEEADREVAEVKMVHGKLNAVAVHFSTSKQHAVEGKHYAVIDWAPNGVWGDADTIKAGYYKQHRYTIIRQHQTKKGG